jgi:hypothetical protein
MSDWTDEEKAEVVTQYEDAKPTPETTMDIVKKLADDFDKTPNGIRMILSKANVYVTKAPAAKADASDKPKRVSKADAIETLEAAITAAGKEVDSEITARLTGKAAVYFAELLAD